MLKRATDSITLLRLLVVLSALVLGAGGAVLGALVASAMRTQAVDDRKAALTEYVDGVLGPDLVHGSKLVVHHRLADATPRQLYSRDDILSIKVWGRDGVLAWTDTDPQ